MEVYAGSILSCVPSCAPVCAPSLILVTAVHIFCYFHLNIPQKLSTWGCAYRILLCMPSIKSPIAKVSLTGTILAVVATGSFGVYSAGGFTAPGSTAATAATGAEPTQSAQESPSESPSPEPTPEPTTPAQKMERTAQNAFGKEGAQATGEIQAPFSTSADAADMLVQQFKGGVVMYTPKYGPVAVESGVYEHWWKQRGYSDFAGWEGLPVSWRSKKGVLYTKFEKAELYWDKANGLPRNTNVLGAKDALVIGDSQVTATSWVGLGLKQAGFVPYLFRCGGIGFVTAREGVCPSYYQGVMGGRWALPNGNPGVIYLDASGNDIYIHEDETKAREHVNAHQTQVIEQLRRMYPSSKIVFGGVVSMDEASAPDKQVAHKRHVANEVARQGARETGVLFMDTSGWQSLYLAEGDMADGVHLKEKAHHKLAGPFATRLRELLGTA